MARIISNETRIGRFHTQNYDRCVVDEHMPFFAVIDSECDDGTAGDIVSNALRHARPKLADAARISAQAVQNVLVDALRAANEAILAIPKGSRGYGGGAAVTACSVSKRDCVVVHVGDCRLYVFKQGAWLRKTTDHTLREAIRCGIRERSEHGDPTFDVGVLLRAVGVSEELEIDTYRFAIDEAATVLLCTRGAWLPMDPTGADTSLPIHVDESHVADFVWDRYVDDGERDNATIIVARMESPI